MAVAVTKDYISLLNQSVSREIQVSIQYMLQHAKMEKLTRKCIPENFLLDKTTYEAVGKFLREFAIEEMKHAAAGMERIYAAEEKHLFKFQEYAKMHDEPEGSPSVPLSEWRKIFTDDYYALLNKAIEAEISAIIQYTNQHEKASLLALREKNTALEVVTESNKASVVSKMLKEIFMVEMDHLEKISERIYLIEGEATFTPDPLPQIGKTTDDFLKLDHEAENYAIVLYRKIIQEALKRNDTKTRRMFEDIVMQEEEHYWRFDDFLK